MRGAAGYSYMKIKFAIPGAEQIWNYSRVFPPLRRRFVGRCVLVRAAVAMFVFLTGAAGAGRLP